MPLLTPWASRNRFHLLTLAAALVFQVLCDDVLAQTKQMRLGLVIGNSVYANPGEGLPGAAADAKSVAAALEKQGFLVRTETNLTREKLMAAIQQFKSNLRAAGTNTIGFLYYAGHGGADRGNSDNFLVPVDAAVKDMAASGVSVRWIQDELQQLRSSANHPAAVVVVIDACRTLTQFGGARGANQPPGTVATQTVSAMTNVSEPEPGYLFAFSTTRNQPAADQGVFAQELIKQMARTGLTLPGVFEEIQREVYRQTNQFPIYQNSIAAQICLVSCETVTKGAYRQNELLLTEARNEADAGIRKLETMDAPNQCQRGWQAARALFASAEKHRRDGNFDTAGETYRAVSERLNAMETYLSAMKTMAASSKQMDAARQSMSNLATSNDFEKSMFLSSYRSSFMNMMGSLTNAEKATRRSVDWSGLRQIAAQMEAFASAGNYVDATERAIEGYNQTLKIAEALLGRHLGQPMPKENQLQAMQRARESRLQLQQNLGSSVDIPGSISTLESSPLGRACKG